MNPKSGDVRVSAASRSTGPECASCRHSIMMLVDVALAVDQQRELAQRPAAYASPLAFEWQPQAPSGQYRLYKHVE